MNISVVIIYCYFILAINSDFSDVFSIFLELVITPSPHDL